MERETGVEPATSNLGIWTMFCFRWHNCARRWFRVWKTATK